MLGASNVARGISVITETSRRMHGRPLEILPPFAGPLLRKNNPLLGLRTARHRRVRPVGVAGGAATLGHQRPGDGYRQRFIYDQPLERIVGWIDLCLRAWRRSPVNGGGALAVGQLAGADRGKISGVAENFFPQVSTDSCAGDGACSALDEPIVELAGIYRAQTISPPREWYGFDAIHIRCHDAARLREILLAWSPDLAPPAQSLLRRCGRLSKHGFSRAPPFFGREWQVRQPWADCPAARHCGSTESLASARRSDA